MYRKALEDLKEWKNNPQRMPLILKGARQVGKTWLMKEFGKQEYKDTAYFSFDNNPRLSSIFNQDFNIRRIIEYLSIEAGFNIKPVETLIVFDEIQENPLEL